MAARFMGHGLIARLGWVLVACVLWDRAALGAEPEAYRSALREALRQSDAAAVRAVVGELVRGMGDRAGEPEVPDRWIPMPVGERLSAEEARASVRPFLEEIRRRRWWKPGLDPTRLGNALREPASVVLGCAALIRAKVAEAEECRGLGDEAARFLVWAQGQAGAGLFPFPAVRGRTNGAAFVAADRFLARMEKEGRTVVKAGWIVEDAGDGGLQFDNGEAGRALVEWAGVTGDPVWLKAAVRAAEWALSQPCVANWNYNSFSVGLLARVGQATGEGRFLDGAVKKALVGVTPGQLVSGPRVGRWFDPHNARPAYHYLLCRGLLDLVLALPPGHPDRAAISVPLKWGLRARNQEVLVKGAATRDKAMEVLLLMATRPPLEGTVWKTGFVQEALVAMEVWVAVDHRRSGQQLGPAEWGLLVEHVLSEGRGVRGR